MNALIIARVNWEVVSAVSGVVSAVVAVVSLLFLARKEVNSGKSDREQGGNVFHYLLFCSAWVLLVLAFNWIVDPFGPFVSEKEERMLYGAMLSAPALMLANYSVNRLRSSQENQQKED